METRPFCSQILEMTRPHFCYGLFVRSDSLGLTQIEGKEISLEYRRQGSLEVILEVACLPPPHTSMFV